MADEEGHGHGDDLAYSQEINRSAQDSLVPLTEDLAEWLTRVLGKALQIIHYDMYETHIYSHTLQIPPRIIT